MHMARKILKSAFVLISLDQTPNFFGWGGRIGLTRSKTANMFKEPYLFLLRRKLKAEGYEHQEIRIKKRGKYFPLFPHHFGDVMHGAIFPHHPTIIQALD